MLLADLIEEDFTVEQIYMSIKQMDLERNQYRDTWKENKAAQIMDCIHQLKPLKDTPTDGWKAAVNNTRLRAARTQAQRLYTELKNKVKRSMCDKK